MHRTGTKHIVRHMQKSVIVVRHIQVRLYLILSFILSCSSKGSFSCRRTIASPKQHSTFIKQPGKPAILLPSGDSNLQTHAWEPSGVTTRPRRTHYTSWIVNLTQAVVDHLPEGKFQAPSEEMTPATISVPKDDTFLESIFGILHHLSCAVIPAY